MSRVFLTVAVAFAGTVAVAQPPGIEPAELFKKLDRNGDGQLTADEIAKDRRRFFERLLRLGDENKDGKLSRKEFLDAVNGKPPATAPATAEQQKRFVEAMFARLDSNRDGNLSLAEIKEERGKQYLAGLLKRAGKKPDGSLTKDEFVRAVLHPNAPPPVTVDGLLRRLDRNRDGVISKDEADGGLKTSFDRLDRNLDGKLDRRELEAALRAAEANRKAALESYRRNAETTFSRLDADKNGRLTVAEIPGNGPRRYVQFLLRRAGRKSDGTFTKEEFIAAVLKHQQEINATVARALRLQDKDNDGQLSRTEVRGFWKANFDRVDRNRDGQLDARELAAALRSAAAAATAKKSRPEAQAK